MSRFMPFFSSSVKNGIAAIQLDTTYVVVSFSLTHMGTLSIVLPRESESISINPMMTGHFVLQNNG